MQCLIHILQGHSLRIPHLSVLTVDYGGNARAPTSCATWSQSPPRSGSHLPSSVRLGVPVSNVSLEMRAPRGQVIEGRNLVLLCSVTEGTGNITFSWHREATGTSVGKKTQRSLSGELEVPAVQERDAGRYYCRADNGHGPIQSKVLSILVRSELRSDSAQTEIPEPRPQSWGSRGRGWRVQGSVLCNTNSNGRMGYPCKLNCGCLSFPRRELQRGLDWH